MIFVPIAKGVLSWIFSFPFVMQDKTNKIGACWHFYFDNCWKIWKIWKMSKKFFTM